MRSSTENPKRKLIILSTEKGLNNSQLKKEPPTEQKENKKTELLLIQ